MVRPVARGRYEASGITHQQFHKLFIVGIFLVVDKGLHDRDAIQSNTSRLSSRHRRDETRQTHMQDTITPMWYPPRMVSARLGMVSKPSVGRKSGNRGGAGGKREDELRTAKASQGTMPLKR